MQKVKDIINIIKLLPLKKKIIYGIIIILIFLGIIIFKPKDNSANITTEIAKIANIKQTVLATGQVTSNTDLNLSFFSSGIVKKVLVKVGDEVKAGQILMFLDQGNEYAMLTQARGAVSAAQARYQRILDGASNEEINLAQIVLDNAKRDYERQKLEQELLVKNAYKNLLNSTPEALPSSGLSDYTSPTISGNYSKEIEGKITISVYYSNSGSAFNIGGIVNGIGTVSSTAPQPIADTGLYIKFPSATGISEWIIDIPNKKAADYIANNNLYEAALKTRDSVLGNAQSLIDQRNAELTLKKIKARPADIELSKADILSAEGQLQLASSNFEHTILRAPSDGTITKVDVKIGELTQALKNIVTLQDLKSVYLEANINEANVASIKIGAPIDITFDAFDADQIFKGYVLKIDPSSTVISGVVNYKITANILNAPQLRPGMTANMTILVGEKNNVLVIPSRAILKDKNENKTVRLVTNSKTKVFEEVEVSAGMDGDGGFTEITNGLKDGDEVVVLIKK